MHMQSLKISKVTCKSHVLGVIFTRKLVLWVILANEFVMKPRGAEKRCLIEKKVAQHTIYYTFQGALKNPINHKGAKIPYSLRQLNFPQKSISKLTFLQKSLFVKIQTRNTRTYVLPNENLARRKVSKSEKYFGIISIEKF